MSTRKILESLIALADAGIENPQVQELAAQAREALESAPTVFVSMCHGHVNDVASDTNDIVVYVIDEDCVDHDGIPAELMADDGSTYHARVKRMQMTAPHFDVDQVVLIAEDNVYANGMKL